MHVAITAVLFLAASGAQAQQNYPEKTVRLIVPYAAGGNADLLGRVVGQKLGEMFSQQFIIDNRGGANGVIGTDLVAKAAPDAIQLPPGTAKILQAIPGKTRPALVLRTDIANVYGTPLPATLFSEVIDRPVEQALTLDAASVAELDAASA